MADTIPYNANPYNAKIATKAMPALVEALAMTGGKIAATGTECEILRLRGPSTKLIDGKGRTVIHGLDDSHRLHAPGYFFAYTAEI